MTFLSACLGVLLSAAEPAPTAVTVEPASLTLSHPRFGHKLLVTGAFADGRLADMSESAEWASRDAKVAEVRDGRVVPTGNGGTVVSAVVAGKKIEVPVTVAGFVADPPVGLRLEIEPVLTKNGCNAGACHGAQYGKGGFKLSLFGSDADADRMVMSREAAGRRVNRANPVAGLVIAKPTGRVVHNGGIRFEPDGREQDLLLRWCKAGCPGEDAKTIPTLAGLQVFPAERTYSRLNERQTLLVVATFSDGSKRDVTRDARFDSNQVGVATVTPEGVVTTVARGESAVMVRYLNRAAVFRVQVVREDGTFRWTDPPVYNFIDGLVDAKLRTMRYVPSPLCTDAEFVRRACLDATGTLPTAEEVTAFLADPAPSREKRAKYIDDLLKRQEFVNWWTLRWGDWLRNSGPDENTRKPMLALHQWIKAGIRDNKPMDRMAVELITARGSTFRDGPANFYRLNRGAPETAEAVAQTFLGIRLQCAKCHQHPFEKWTQDDYYGLAAYFARMSTKGDPEYGLFGGASDIVVKDSGEVSNPRTGKVMAPTPLGAGKVLDDPADRRLALARWLTEKDNLLLARHLANRYWAIFLGRGLVEPVDDVRDTNPPTNPQLLDALARDLVAHGYDMRHLVRTIMNSRTYQLSGTALHANAEDTMCYSRYYVKRLSAEQLLDAVCRATGVQEKFKELPAGTRAIDLPDPATGSYFLDIFGRPKREINCECERQGDPNMSQALHLINGDLINAKVTSATGRVSGLLKAGKTDPQIIEELYLVTLARKPSETERGVAGSLVAGAPSRKEGLEDLLWTLCNCKEFLFNH